MIVSNLYKGSIGVIWDHFQFRGGGGGGCTFPLNLSCPKVEHVWAIYGVGVGEEESNS